MQTWHGMMRVQVVQAINKDNCQCVARSLETCGAGSIGKEACLAQRASICKVAPGRGRSGRTALGVLVGPRLVQACLHISDNGVRSACCELQACQWQDSVNDGSA